MDFPASREKLPGSDFECSQSDSKWNSENPPILTKNEGKTVWAAILSSLSSFGVSAEQECNSPPKFSDQIVDEKVELLIVTNSGEDCGDKPPEKNNAKEKQKKNKNAGKPPRPPKGPSLDAADVIFVKEITELAMKRRERMERLRALKKAKADKFPSFNSSATALIITLLFLIVLLFQGISSRSSPSAARSEHGGKSFISDQYFESNAPDSASTKFVLRLL